MPALPAFADILQGPYATYTNCKSIEQAYRHDPTYRVTFGCEELNGGYWFQWVYA